MSIIDDFSCYHVSSNIPINWWQLEPTLYWNVPNSDQKSKQPDVQKVKVRSTSAYALFFREKQGPEKLAAPDATFGQISQRIARQWEQLTAVEKKAYKQRCEKTRRTNIAKAVEEKARQLLVTSQVLKPKNENND